MNMKRFLKGFLIFTALAGVGIASAFAVVALLLRHEEVKMPDLIGQDIVTVIDSVTQQGLLLKVDRREPSLTVPRDTVTSQSPAPGIGIMKGRQVHVVVSRGPSGMEAPKLVGEHFRKAEVMIRQAGFVPGDVARASSDAVERDIVIAQDPQVGNPLEKGGRVNLLVSDGRKAMVFVMPVLSGKTVDKARQILDHMGLQYRLISRSGAAMLPIKDRLVIAQKPDAGYPIASDDVVELAVNR